MWIWLDKNGKVEQYLTHGKSPVVGDTDFQIFAYFDGLDINYFDSATIKFRKPDRQGSTYPVLFMKRVDMPYEYMKCDGSMSNFNENGSPYPGFLFDFSDFTEGDEIVRLLDTPGLWEATITVLGSPNKTNVSGLITFNVGSSTSDSEDQTILTLDQILENLVLAQRILKKNSTAYLKVASNFASDANNGLLDASIFSVGSVVLDETTKNFYKIQTITVNAEDETKVFATYTKVFEYLKIENLNNDLTLNDLYELNGEKPIISKYNSKNYIISIIKNDSNSFNFNAICLNDFKKYSSTESGDAKWYISIELDKQFIEVDDNLNLESINPVQNKVITKELNNKLNKVTGTTQYTQVYAKSGNTGAQAMIGVSSSSVPSNIVRRGADSLFDVSEPVNDNNPTTKKYVDDTINSKMENLNIRNGVGPYSLILKSDAAVHANKALQHATIALGGSCEAGMTEPEFNEHFKYNRDGSLRNPIVDDSRKPYATSESYACAIGEKAKAKDRASFSVGMGTVAMGAGSQAFGDHTYALSNFSTAIGNNTIAGTSKYNGEGAFAQGYFTEAPINYSSAFGAYTKTLKLHSTVVGQYNKLTNDSGEDYITKGIFSVGTGNSINTRRTTFTVTVNNEVVVSDSEAKFINKGTTELKGRSTYPLGISPVSDYELVTKGYVNNEMLNKADLVNGRVPSSQLPSYVDDVLNISSIETVYSKLSELPNATAQNHGVVYLCINSNQVDEESLNIADKSTWAVGFLIENVLQEDGTRKWQYRSTLEPHKIYIVIDTNKTYRYTMSGETHLVEISASLALGETAGSAYAGDKGKANADAIASLQENKLDKVTGTTQYTQVYAKSGNTGAQAMIGVSSTSVPSNIVRRGADSLFDVSEPVNDSNPTTKKYVDDLNSSKVDKINNLDDNNPYVLYGAEFNDIATEQKTYPMSEDAIARTIARRGLSGELSVGDPILESDATNKKYVNELLNLYVKYSDIDTDFSLTSTNPLQNKVISKQIKDINYTIMVMKEELFETVLSEVDYKVDYATIYPIPDTLSDNDGTHRVVYSDTQFKEVEGNSVAFNQLCEDNFGSSILYWSKNRLTQTNNNNVATFVTNSNVYEYVSFYHQFTAGQLIKGHKYLVSIKVKLTSGLCKDFTLGMHTNFSAIISNPIQNQWYELSFIWENTRENDQLVNAIICQRTYNSIDDMVVNSDSFEAKEPQVFDLTLMGLDSITTVEEFNRIFPNDYYPYNAGEIKNTVIKGIKVNRYNLFDGELEIGGIDSDGTLNTSNLGIRSKNYIEVSNKAYTYEITKSGGNTVGTYFVCEYDKNKTFIKRNSLYQNNSSIQVSNNCNYVKIFFYCSTQATLSGVQICFHLTGTRTGYAPYVKPRIINIPQTELPSAGSVHDTIKFVEGNVAAGQQRFNMVRVSRTDNVDLGTLNYGYVASSNLFYATIDDIAHYIPKDKKANIICSIYEVGTYNEITALSKDKIIAVNDDWSRIYIRNTAYTDATAFKTAMSGIMLNYEKAEPTETTLATDLTFEDVSAIIEQGGSIETIFEIVPPNLKTAFVVNKAIVS